VNVNDCDRILVIKPSSLGDIIHTIPAVLAIHRTVPGVEISWVVNTEWAPLLEGLPFLKNVIHFPRKKFRGVPGILAANQWAARELKSLKPTLTIDFQGLLRSGWMTWKSRPECSVGFAKNREGAGFFYDVKVPVENWTGTHAVDRYMALARACGVSSDSATGFELPEGDSVDGLNLPESGPWVLLHPFSRGDGKSLTVREVVDFCREAAPLPVVLVGAGGPDFPEILPENAVNLMGKTSLGQLISVIRKASWTVSVDSGPMHLAAGITDRVLSIHTWSDPKIVGPRPEEAWIWRAGQIMQRGNIADGQFPGQRELRDSFASADRLLPDGELKNIAEFVQERIQNSE